MDTSQRYTPEGIKEFAETFPFFSLIGLEVLEVEAGSSKTRLRHRPDLAQPAGILHGGVLASLIDTGIAHALLMTDRFRELREEEGALVSVDLRVKFLRPVSEGDVYCEAKVTRMGRQIVHAEAIVTHAGGKEVARGDAIYMAVPGRRIQGREAPHPAEGDSGG